MRINPKHDNTCHNRIGMYRAGQCTDGPHPCVFLGECDQMGDYDLEPMIRSSARKFPTGTHYKRTAKEQGGINRMMKP